MSVAFELFSFKLSFTIPLTVEVLVEMGVRTCLCPSSYRAVCMNSPLNMLSNKPPNFASVDEDITLY